jgi:hypothetical protein
MSQATRIAIHENGRGFNRSLSDMTLGASVKTAEYEPRQWSSVVLDMNLYQKRCSRP